MTRGVPPFAALIAGTVTCCGMSGLLAVQRPVAAGGGASLPAYSREGMVKVTVGRGRGVVVAGAVEGVVTTCGGVGTMTGWGIVVGVTATAVVGGASSCSTASGSVVVVADDEPELPDPEDDREP